MLASKSQDLGRGRSLVGRDSYSAIRQLMQARVHGCQEVCCCTAMRNEARADDLQNDHIWKAGTL